MLHHYFLENKKKTEIIRQLHSINIKRPIEVNRICSVSSC